MPAGTCCLVNKPTKERVIIQLPTNFMSSQNVCIKCGKERVAGKTWTETVGSSIVTHSATTCPDANCQKSVEKSLFDQKEKRNALTTQREAIYLARLKAARAKKLASL